MASTPNAAARVEITDPVSLTNPSGGLNPSAVGWTRTPLHDTDAIGTTWTSFMRNKRWEYWAVVTPTHIISLTVSNIDYAGVCALFVLDRATNTEINTELVAPLAWGVTLPGTLDGGVASVKSRGLDITITPEEGGTRLQARSARVSIDIFAALPKGHERLGVVVPWSGWVFQYTVKDIGLPATGTVTIDGTEIALPPGQSWATLDHGRGRWPRSITWNWGTGVETQPSGRVVGIQVGGKWTDGTGATENSLLVDGRVSKIHDELQWTYDIKDLSDKTVEKVWKITGDGVDLKFRVEHVREAHTDLKIITSKTWQCFGAWSGTVKDENGKDVVIEAAYGWAEHVEQYW